MSIRPQSSAVLCDCFAYLLRRGLPWLLAAVLFPAAVVAETAAEPAAPSEGDEKTRQAEAEQVLQERVRVIGDPEAVDRVAGSAYFLDEEELDKNNYTDIQRLLRRVPGVNLQDEEGYGMRPNIGMRGTGVERGQKVTMMEDGVLIAPAPYSAPSAYYFPTAGRMNAVEVSKGPASIRQGPYTNGGVLNMISTPIPSSFGGRADLAVGNDGHTRGRAHVGDAGDRFGWVIEGYREDVDGFKELDGGGDTGFDLTDFVGKVRVNSPEGSRLYQSLELKLGKTEQEGDETYLGLTDADYAASPYRRYVASSADVINTDHEQAVLQYFVVPTGSLDLTTTVYYNDFFRNWSKLQDVNGVGINSVLDDPVTYANEIAIIRGEMDSDAGALDLRNNRRDYYSAGIQTTLGVRLGGGKTKHDLEFGLRVHRDEEDRFQEEDEYQMLGGELVFNARGTPASQSNRIDEAFATAFFARDTIETGNWTLSPGVRLESIDYTRTDYGKTDPGRTGADLSVKQNDVFEVIPGVGVDYGIGADWNVFFGVHRGFSPPGPGQAEAVDSEESVNYELGTRHRGRSTSLQAVGFFNDYDNLLGVDTLSGGGGGSGDAFNGGAVQVYGLELAWSQVLRPEAAVQLPYQLAYTLTRGEFRTRFETDFADWAPRVETGDELPYLPEHQLFGEFGLRSGPWSAFVGASYVDEMRTHAGQGPIPETERIEDHLVVDLSAEYSFRGHYRVFLQMRNVTDEVYVAARRPAGLRPGLPRTTLFGIGFDF